MTKLDLSKIILNIILSITTFLSTIIGGIWAYHKWRMKRKESSMEKSVALDGRLEIETVKDMLNEEYMIITTLANWNNKSPKIVYIDKDETRIEVYEIKKDNEMVVNDDTAKLIDIVYIYMKKREFIFQPKTNSTLYHHFKLKKNKTYLIRWKLYKDKSQYDNKEFAWTLEKVFNL